MYGVKEAAIKLGISDRRVRKLLEEGRIKGKKLGRDWVVIDLNYTKKKPKGGKKGRQYIQAVLIRLRSLVRVQNGPPLALLSTAIGFGEGFERGAVNKIERDNSS